MKLRCGSKITLMVFGFCFVGFVCLSRAYANDSFQELGVLPGYFNTRAYDISGDGSTVVGWCWSTTPSGWPEKQAFRWKDGVMIGLGFLPGYPPPGGGMSADSMAFGVSADGSVVVGVSGYHPEEISSGNCWAFRWAGGTMSPLPAPVIPGYMTADCSARGISADGSVVVGSVNGSDSQHSDLSDACRWAGGTVTFLGSPWPYPYNNYARRVSGDGSVVVGYGSCGGFRWENGTIISLGGGGTNQGANGVSADGSVVVGVGAGGGFRWENGTMTSLGKCTPYDVSADGSVIVGSGWDGKAFIWDANHGLRNLRDVLVNDYLMDLQGYPAEAFGEACGISDDGSTIIGSWWIARLDMGMVTAVRGNATLDGLTAKVLDHVRQLSTVETGGDGYVRIRHPSGSEINMGPNSKMQIDGSPAKTNLELIKGRLMEKVRNIPAGYDFNIRTPQAVSSRRGTELLVETTSTESKTIVLEGEADVSTPDGSQTITLGQNQGIIATVAGLGNPFPVDPSQIDRWWEWEDENTPQGKEVVVSDPETHTTILFDNVEEGGETTVTLTSIEEGPPPPGGMKIVPLGTYYEINTTAEFSDTIHIKLEYDDTNLTEGEETALELLQHDEGTGQWVDITTGLDTQDNIISGETVHLSFFAVTTTPPTINSVSASPDVLWPPNHKMVEVIVTVDCEDICDPTLFCYILGVSSNEPINGPGDGNTEPDWEYTDDPLSVLLRAECAGGGDGRIYTIYVECKDASGNIAITDVEVTVPHDRGKGKGKKK